MDVQGDLLRRSLAVVDLGVLTRKGDADVDDKRITGTGRFVTVTPWVILGGPP